jgi:hypothetical protein
MGGRVRGRSWSKERRIVLFFSSPPAQAPTLINEFLSSRDSKKSEIAMWILGNISAEKDPQLGHSLVAMGMIEPSLRLFG